VSIGQETFADGRSMMRSPASRVRERLERPRRRRGGERDGLDSFFSPEMSPWAFDLSGGGCDDMATA